MNACLPYFVSLTGLVVLGVGLFGVVAPTNLVRVLADSRVVTRLPVTITIRLVVGTLFVMAAPVCRLPALVRLIGVLEFAGAAVLLGLGAGRLERFVVWWLERSPAFVRGWCLCAFAFGTVLVYAGA